MQILKYVELNYTKCYNALLFIFMFSLKCFHVFLNISAIDLKC